MGLIMHFYQDIPLKRIKEQTNLIVEEIDDDQVLVKHISGAACYFLVKGENVVQAKIGSGNQKLIFQEFAKNGMLFMSEYALAEFVHTDKDPTFEDWLSYTNSVWD